MFKKTKLAIITILIATFSLSLFTGCSDKKSLASETVMSSFVFDTNLETCGKMFIDEDNELKIYNLNLSGIKKFNVYKGTLEDFSFSDKIISALPELNNSDVWSRYIFNDNDNNIHFKYELSNDDYYICIDPKKDELLYKFGMSEIEGADDLYGDDSMFESFSTLENRNLQIKTSYWPEDLNSVNKVAEINPYTKELISKTDYPKEDFYTEEDLLSSSASCNYENFTYSVTPKGIFRKEIGSDKESLVLDASETDYINSDSMFVDIYAVSEEEIYVSLQNFSLRPESWQEETAQYNYIRYKLK